MMVGRAWSFEKKNNKEIWAFQYEPGTKFWTWDQTRRTKIKMKEKPRLSAMYVVLSGLSDVNLFHWNDRSTEHRILSFGKIAEAYSSKKRIFLATQIYFVSWINALTQSLINGRDLWQRTNTCALHSSIKFWIFPSRDISENRFILKNSQRDSYE